MPGTVAIVGRPNVGKSTLFNRLSGKRHAIVDDQPGVTRDWREAEGRIADLSFRVLDTAGLEEAADDALETRMLRQTMQAVERADVVMLVVDGLSGLTPADRQFADLLRRADKPLIVAVNKCEQGKTRDAAAEVWELGLGEPVPISAEHGQGMSDLYDILQPLLESPNVISDPETASTAKQLQLAIVGRPNVGKSTLMNTLLGEERVLTGPEAGITRDAIATPWQWDDQELVLIDTAGMRRKANIDEALERKSVRDSLRSVQYAQVCVLMLDATMPFEKQDLTIARHLVEEGRAVVVALNKWDKVSRKKHWLDELDQRLDEQLPQIRGVPMIPISAMKGQGLKELMQAVFEVYEAWNQRITTAKLNKFLEAAVAYHPPPLVQGRRLKIRYMTQVKSRPPRFVLFVSKPDAFPEHYLRYLTARLREEFQLWGIPLRLMLRGGKNPYTKKEGKK